MQQETRGMVFDTQWCTATQIGVGGGAGGADSGDAGAGDAGAGDAGAGADSGDARGGGASAGDAGAGSDADSAAGDADSGDKDGEILEILAGNHPLTHQSPTHHPPTGSHSLTDSPP